MLETKKYTLTVEGETEKWYFLWLRDQINKYEGRMYNVSIVPKVKLKVECFVYRSSSSIHRFRWL